MHNGLWTIEFSSESNFFGNGVLVLIEGRLLGGDHGYYYSGNYEINGTDLHGRVNVIRYDPNSISVFGDIDNFSLNLEGSISDSELIVVAGDVNNSKNTMHITGKKKEEL